jgi:hypothetical protein
MKVDVMERDTHLASLALELHSTRKLLQLSLTHR